MEYFTSDVSKDRFSIRCQNHDAYFKLECIDNVEENLNLFNKVLEFMKNKDIRWVIISITNYATPLNAYLYENKKTGGVHCHSADFEKFYMENLSKLVKPNNVHVGNSTNKDGWTIVRNIKNVKMAKVKKIKKEVDKIVCDWNAL